MKHLPGFHPTRRQLPFEQLFLEHPDEFYELHYSQVRIEIDQLVKKAFCTADGYGTGKSPWVRGYSEQFCKHVDMLARPDILSGHWDRLLRDQEQRSYLLQAIIMRILHSQILSSLLFGADPQYIKLLRSGDTALIDAEGRSYPNLAIHVVMLKY